MADGVAMSLLADPIKVWTFDDLEHFPEEYDTRRWEIVDGALVVTPAPGMRHESVSARLRNLLQRAGAPDFFVVGPMGVDLGASHRVPDLVVVRSALTRTRIQRVLPTDAQMVVEIVSPSSRTTDRIAKPAQYAEFGIRTYLRVETEPEVTVTVSVLDGAAYRELGTYGRGEVAHLDQPFAVAVPVDDITP